MANTKDKLLKKLGDLKKEVIREFNAFEDEMVERYGLQPYTKEQYPFIPDEYEYYLTILMNTNFLNNPEARDQWKVENLKSLISYLEEKREQMRKAMDKKRKQMEASTKIPRAKYSALV